MSDHKFAMNENNQATVPISDDKLLFSDLL